MALNIKTRYGSRANDPSIDYPTGSIKNKSAPDATDGTPLEKDWANDWLGARDAILSEASIVADGEVEKVGSSQVLLAIKAIADAAASAVAQIAGIFSSSQVVTANTTFSIANVGRAIEINSATATSHNLPSASTYASGRAISFANINSGIATFNRAGSDTITGGNLSAATAIALNNGECVTLVSDGANKWYVASSNVTYFGAPRAWQTLTASRAIGTTYTNSTGREIDISISIGTAISPGYLTIGTTASYAQPGSATISTIQGTVPIGGTYSVTYAGTIVQWSEYR